MKKPQLMLIPIAVLLALLVGLFFFSETFLPHRNVIIPIALVLSAVVVLAAWGVIAANQRELLHETDLIFSENAGTAATIIRSVSVPCLLADEKGNIVWQNDVMEKVCNDSVLTGIMPDYDFMQPPAAYSLEHSGGIYQVMSMQVRRKSTDRLLTFQYWTDRTEAAHYQRLYEEKRPYIALIYVDNFEELSADRQFHRSAVLTEVERLVADLSASLEGVYRRYENGRFMLVFESRHLEGLEESKFAVLESARQIDTGTVGSVSLSVAIGVADSISQSDESARQAMELALGRGGDQAVVKRGTNYSFYGGKRQLDSMQSRVKARLFAKALRQMFENSGDIFIMGHKNADMDCIGGSLGIAACAKMIGSRAYIVLDEPNETISLALDAIKNSDEYADCLITPEEAERMWRPSAVLVVVDTQRPVTTCAPSLIDLASRIVLIDHHRRSADYIDSSTLHYLESRASSASELITEVVQYFDDTPRVPAFISSALLAGITVDTKHFAFNVGSRTFEAAGYLRKNGADIGVIKQMFQDDMESFRLLSGAVSGAEILPGGIALTCCEGALENGENEKLLAAKVSDQLINIKGIEAAFSLGRDGDIISVSGRSLGKINAQLICERLGGGGHLTMAGAQLTDITMNEARELVKARIEEYTKEVGLL